MSWNFDETRIRENGELTHVSLQEHILAKKRYSDAIRRMLCQEFRLTHNPLYDRIEVLRKKDGGGDILLHYPMADDEFDLVDAFMERYG